MVAPSNSENLSWEKNYEIAEVVLPYCTMLSVRFIPTKPQRLTPAVWADSAIRLSVLARHFSWALSVVRESLKVRERFDAILLNAHARAFLFPPARSCALRLSLFLFWSVPVWQSYQKSVFETIFDVKWRFLWSFGNKVKLAPNWTTRKISSKKALWDVE